MNTGWIRSEMDEDKLRQAVMPMIDSYLRMKRASARLGAAKRKAIQHACEDEFRIRLDSFAGAHGFFGEDRAFLNEFVTCTFDERAAATEPDSQEVAVASQPAAVVSHRWCVVVLVLAAAVGVLLVMR